MDFFGAGRWGRELALDLFFLAPPPLLLAIAFVVFFTA